MAINENKKAHQKLESERKRYLTIVTISNLLLASLFSTILYFGFPSIEISIALSFAILIASSTTAVSYCLFLVLIKRLKNKSTIYFDDKIVLKTKKDLSIDEYKVEDRNTNIIDLNAMLANEFRAPLTILKNNLGNLDKTITKTPEHLQTLANINSASFELDSLINNAIYITKFQERQFKVDLSSIKIIDVFELIREQIKRISDSLDKKIRVSILPNLPKIDSDPKAMSLALYNLLGFIIKHGSESIVTINSRFVDNNLEIYISSKANTNINETIQNSLKDGSEILGNAKANLGIFVAKIIIEAHNGNLIFENQIQSTQFKIVIPVSKN